MDLAREVGTVLGRVGERPLREQRGEVGDQRLQARSRPRADREQLVHGLELRGGRQRGGGLRAAEAIALVDRADDGRPLLRAQQRPGDEPVAGADSLVPIDDEQRGVGVAQLSLDASLHSLGERVARPLHSGQVDQDHLPTRGTIGGDAANRPAGGLRTVGDDRHLGAHDRVDQRRLAHVRATGEANEAGSRHRRSSLARSSIAGRPQRLHHRGLEGQHLPHVGFVVVAAEVKNAVDRRPIEIDRVLGADDDVPELAWAGDPLGPVDREGQHVGRLVATPMLAVQLADPFRRHELHGEMPFDHPRRPQGSLGRRSQPPGNVRQVQGRRGQAFLRLSRSYSP